MSFKFDPSKRPEDNIRDFITYAKGIDLQMGNYVESNVQDILELGEDRSKSALRGQLNRGAINLLFQGDGDHE